MDLQREWEILSNQLKFNLSLLWIKNSDWNKKAQDRLTKLVLKYNAMYITFHQASSLIHVLITSLSQFFFAILFIFQTQWK